MFAIPLLLAAATLGPQRPAWDCSGKIDPTRRVDATFVRRIDLDGDGRPDEVRLRVRGPRFDRAFVRELTVLVRGRVVVRKTQNDARLDEGFADTAYTSPCTGGYARCKCEWYSRTVLAETVFVPDPKEPGVFDAEMAEDSLVKNCGASRSGARKAVGRAEARQLRAPLPMIADVISPVQAGDELSLWIPEYRCFAQIYQD